MTSPLTCVRQSPQLFVPPAWSRRHRLECAQTPANNMHVTRMTSSTEWFECTIVFEPCFLLLSPSERVATLPLLYQWTLLLEPGKYKKTEFKMKCLGIFQVLRLVYLLLHRLSDRQKILPVVCQPLILVAPRRLVHLLLQPHFHLDSNSLYFRLVHPLH